MFSAGYMDEDPKKTRFFAYLSFFSAAMLGLGREHAVPVVLANAVRYLRAESLLDWAYRHFARWRLRRRCDEGACVASVETGSRS